MDKYEFIPWKQYRMFDTGVFAPKGSNPKFHTELRNMTHDMNPKHPFIVGCVMHDEMKPDELVPTRYVHISNIDYTK